MKKGTMNAVLPPSPVFYHDVGRDKRRVITKVVAEDPSFIPEYKTSGSACCDLLANLPDGPITLNPGDTEKVDCGIAIQLLPGYEALIRARSGLASKGIICTNATEEEQGGGTIDDDYRLRMKVILSNVGKGPVTIEHKDRIAQMGIKPVWYFDFEATNQLDDNTDRKGGFGSTGVK